MLDAMRRVIVHPSLDKFLRERDHADFGRAIVGTLAIGALAGGVGGILNVLAIGDSIGEAIALTIVTPLRFIFALILSQAFLLASARVLGGRGEFATQFYLGALGFVPLNAIGILLVAIPAIGAALALAMLLYSMALNVFALRAAHGGTAWRVPNGVLFILSISGGILGWFALSSIGQ